MRRYWLKGKALGTAIALGFRPEPGDEVILKDIPLLRGPYRGFRTKVREVRSSGGPDEYHIVPIPPDVGDCCYVELKWIAAVRKGKHG